MMVSCPAVWSYLAYANQVSTGGGCWIGTNDGRTMRSVTAASRVALWLMLQGTAGSSQGAVQLRLQYIPRAVSSGTGHMISDSISHAALRTGLYIGSWQDGYHSHWLVLYLNGANGRAVLYDPPKASDLCSVSIKGKIVTFRSGQLVDWPSGTRYSLAFKGSLTPRGMRGQLLVVGGAYDRRVSSSEFSFYAIDAEADSADGPPQGVYSSVRAVPETGDLLGDELMLIKSGGRRLALWTDYEGAPSGPYWAESLRQRGDTVMVAGTWGLVERPWAFARVFVLGYNRAATQPDTSRSTPEANSPPTLLAKTYDLVGFLAPSNATPCSGAERNEQGSRKGSEPLLSSPKGQSVSGNRPRAPGVVRRAASFVSPLTLSGCSYGQTVTPSRVRRFQQSQRACSVAIRNEQFGLACHSATFGHGLAR
jgi:hypothetical protein